MSARAATRLAIEAAHAHDAFYKGYLASHLPMALAALDAMGADDAVIAAFATRYGAQLEPIRASALALVPGEERAHLGSSAAYPAWVGHFEGRLARAGAGAVLREWCPVLLEGVAGGAFHGIIRTAYAVELGSDAELAHALAYWAASWQSLGPPPAPAGSLAPLEVLARVAADSRFAGQRAAGRNIAERTAAAAGSEALHQHVAATDSARLDLDGIARALIAAYCASGDFTVLHGVTGCHAARVLRPYLGRSGPTLPTLWHALVAAYAGSGCPPVRGWALEGNDGLPWPAILERAVACHDEHDVKLAYTCWREWQRTGDASYRRAASARVCHALRETAAC